MSRKECVSRAALSIVFILILGSFIPVFYTDNTEPRMTNMISEPDQEPLLIAGTPHDPIVIDGDANFSATALIEGWIGDGSSGTPYVIHGLDIDRGGVAGHCISIINTQVNFTIRSCNLTGASISPYAGIYLRNVRHGMLEDNIFQNNNHDMDLTQSSFIIIKNNTCFDSIEQSINLDESSNNQLSYNNCSNSGGSAIHLDNDCTYNVIENNTLSANTWDGIFLDGSYNSAANNTCNNNLIGITIDGMHNTAVDNICNNNDMGVALLGIYITVANNTCTFGNQGIWADGLYNTVENNICNDNQVGIYVGAGNSHTISENSCNRNFNGIFLTGQLHTVVNNTCSSNTQSGIYLIMGHSSILSKNTCDSNTQFGIVLDSVYGMTLMNNTCDGSSQVGIYLHSSHTNDLTHNECSDGPAGYYFDSGSDNNNLRNNTCINNDRGMRFEIGAITNTMTWNNFINSAIENCRDEGIANIFDFNYWSDYSGNDSDSDAIGDTPFFFTSNNDPHPLMYPNIMIQLLDIPNVHTIEYTLKYQYDFNSTSLAPESWTVNNTEYFNIDSNGVLVSTWILPVGVHGLQVTVNNVYGQEISAVYQIHVVVDAQNPPEWLFIPTDQILAFNEILNYQIAVVDPSGIDRWVLNDTVNFNLQTTFYTDGSTAHITNSSVLLPGSYGLNLTAYDNYDNKISAIFTVTIMPLEDTTPPAWVTLRISQTIEYGQALQIQLESWDASGIDHYWLNDTVHFTLDEYGLIQNSTLLQPAVYKLEVRAYDPYDNYCSATLVVTVLEAPVTTTTTTTTTTTPTSITTTNTTTDTISDGINPVMTLLLGTGLGGVSVVVVVIIVLRRKS